MTEELNTTPKVGLVDKRNNGAHKDMNYSLFCKSIDAITPHLRFFAETATKFSGKELAEQLRAVGIQAEKSMFSATNGINTHKGAIFCLSLAVAAAVNCGTLHDFCAYIADVASHLSYVDNSTHGAKMRAQYAINGAIEYAQAGYSGILLQTQANYDAIPDINSANVKNLLFLISSIDDTNVYYRGGAKTANQLKAESLAIYNQWTGNKQDYDKVYALDDKMIEQGISAGGSADMLVLSIFVNKLHINGFLSRKN